MFNQNVAGQIRPEVETLDSKDLGLTIQNLQSAVERIESKLFEPTPKAEPRNVDMSGGKYRLAVDLITDVICKLDRIERALV